MNRSLGELDGFFNERSNKYFVFTELITTIRITLIAIWQRQNSLQIKFIYLIVNCQQ